MSDFTKTRFVLAVQDLARSTDYYTSVLGLGIEFTADELAQIDAISEEPDINLWARSAEL